MWLSVELDVLMADLTVQLPYSSVIWWIWFGARGHQCEMGHARSMVGVGDESGRHDWSMRRVDENDVGCRRGELLSCWLFMSVLF